MKSVTSRDHMMLLTPNVKPDWKFVRLNFHKNASIFKSMRLIFCKKGFFLFFPYHRLAFQLLFTILKGSGGAKRQPIVRKHRSVVEHFLYKVGRSFDSFWGFQKTSCFYLVFYVKCNIFKKIWGELVWRRSLFSLYWIVNAFLLLQPGRRKSW